MFLPLSEESYAFESIPRSMTEKALGTVKETAISLKEMQGIFFDEIALPQIVNKSELQKRHWISKRQYTSDLICKIFAKKRLERLVTRMR